MKRITIRIICLVLFILMSPEASMAQRKDIIEVIELPDHVFSAAKVYDSLYLLGEQGLYRWSPERAEVEMVENYRPAVSYRYLEERPEDTQEAVLWDHLVSRVFSDGREALLLHPYTLEVTALHPDGSRLTRYALPIDRLRYDREGENALREIKQILLISGKVYLLLGTDQAMNQMKTDVAVYDARKDEFSILPIKNAQGIYAGKEGELLVLQVGMEQDSAQKSDITNGLYAYDMNDESLGKLLSPLTQDVGGYAYDQVQKRILYTHKGQVFALGEDGVETIVAYIPVSNNYPQKPAFLISDDHYVLVEADSLISRKVTTKDLAEQTVLRFMGNLDQEVIRKYSVHRPNVSVVAAADGVADTDQIAASIIGRDSGIDLYVLSDLRSFYSARDKGYAASMNNSTSLLEKSSRLHPALQNVLMKEGQLLGFPILLQEELWSINQSAWQRFNLGEPPQTLATFLELMRKWDQKFADENPNYSFTDSQYMSFYVRHIIKNYILGHANKNEPLNFSAPVLYDAMSALESYRQVLTLSDEQKQRNMDALYTIVFTYSFASLSNARVDDEIYGLFLPPAINADEDPVYTARASILFLNELGNQKEAALDFIEFYMENIGLETRYKLFVDLSEPLRRDTFESDLAQQKLIVDNARRAHDAAEGANKSELEGQLKREESRLERLQDDWLISPEVITAYRALSKHMVFPNAYALSLMQGEESLIQDIGLYSQGAIPLDRFLDALNRKARLIYHEETTR